jgi:cytochrome c biogenesis protein CcmG/thiol:disulfide interchange protein DsbE
MDKNSETLLSRWVSERLGNLEPPNHWVPNEGRAFSLLKEKSVGKSLYRRKEAWITAGLLIACLFVSASSGPRVLAERCVGVCKNLLFGSADTARLPRQAPDFLLQDSAGSKIRLSDYRGRVILVNFWATWCAPCKAEIPLLEEFEHAYASQGLTVIGVSMDENGWSSVRPFMEALKINYPVVIGGEELASQYGLIGLPTTFLVDREGRIAATHVGILSRGDVEHTIMPLLVQ